MYEHLADLFGGLPNAYHFSLYSKWSRYSWGMIITGNVQVSDRHLSLGRDMVVPKVLSEEALLRFRQLATVIRGGENPIGTSVASADASIRPTAIMQLNHSGRQSSNIIGGRSLFHPPLAPSAIPVGSRPNSIGSRLFHRLLFQTPRAMSHTDIDEVVFEFIRGAKLALESGFDGVELHVAHGCKFLSRWSFSFHICTYT